MPNQTIRILVLDNNREYCEELATWLRRQNSRYMVDIATSEMEALGLMSETGEYDVALIDQVLGPESDGLDVMRKIRKRNPDTGIIMYTGWGIVEHQEKALAALREGATYLSKASDKEEILLWIKHVVDRRRSGKRQEPASPPELSDALTRRTLALFIGDDLPREVIGLPSRAGLARDLACRKGVDESLSLAEVAQRVGQAGNRWEFTTFIRDALDTTGKSPQPFHRHIVKLVKTYQIETIITTAYDNLLELSFQEAGIGINRVVRGSDVNFINPGRPTLIKLYGDAQQPDTLVVTDRDHLDLLRDREREPLIDEVRRAFRHNTVLILGYNLADPDFRFLFDQIAESRFARTAYALWPGLPEEDVRMWWDRGIVILEADPWGVLDNFIDTTASNQTKTFPNEVMSEEVLYLNTSATLFAQWLADYTRMIPHRDFPTQKGTLTLQSIKSPLSIQSPTTLTMDTLYIVQKKDKDSEMAWPICAAITFRVIPLSNERVEVQVKCHQPAVADYFRELLDGIKQRWPVKNIISLSETAFVPHYRPEPTSISSVLQSSIGGNNMDYERGLDILKRLTEGTDWYQNFAVYEASLRENLGDERRYGPSEQSRRDRARLIDQLNALALNHLDISFNDLCMGEQPKIKRLDRATTEDIATLIQELKAIVIEINSAEREASELLWQAVQQSRVEQGEIAATVEALRRWARNVQKAGLPADKDLRAAILSLTQPTDSVEGMYNYLHFALPLLPGLLSVESEIDLNKLWAEIKERWGKKSAKDR